MTHQEAAKLSQQLTFPMQASPKGKSPPITLCIRESILLLPRADISVNVE
jgi:hypothetical protein